MLIYQAGRKFAGMTGQPMTAHWGFHDPEGPRSLQKKPG
jgi:hypothetical protein